MARADYDYNIWSDSPSTLSLGAYRQYYDMSDDMWIRTDTSNYETITFTFPQDCKEIEYLLQDLYLNQYPLTDYDEWVENPFLFGAECPEKIAKFLNELPDYEMEKRYANAG